MVFRKFLNIFLIFIFSNIAFSEEVVSSSELVERLKNTGELGMFDAPIIDVFNASCSESVTLSSINTGMKAFCETVTSSEICKNVEKKDLLNCDRPDESKEFDTFDFITGCATGLFDGVKAILKFMWDVLKWVWDKGTHPKESYQEASEVTESLKLYLSTEFDKAYDKASPPFRRTKAAGAITGKVTDMLFTAIQDFMYKEYQEFGCLNFKAQTHAMCKVAAELLVPPYMALKLLKGKKLSWEMEKIKLAGEYSLGRPLTKTEMEAIKNADYKGKDWFHSDYYKFGHDFGEKALHAKLKILEEAGFSKKEIMKLMEDGAVSVSAKEFTQLFGTKVAETARRIGIRQADIQKRIESSLGRSLTRKGLDAIIQSRLMSKIDGGDLPRTYYHDISWSGPEIRIAKGEYDGALGFSKRDGLSKLVRDGIVGESGIANAMVKSYDEMLDRVIASSSRNITPDQMVALDRVRLMDMGQKGRNGMPAKSGNHSVAQLKERAKILEEANFSASEASQLVRAASSPDPFVISKKYDQIFHEAKKILGRDPSISEINLIEAASRRQMGRIRKESKVSTFKEMINKKKHPSLLEELTDSDIERLIKGGVIATPANAGVRDIAGYIVGRRQHNKGFLESYNPSDLKITITAMSNALEKVRLVGKGKMREKRKFLKKAGFSRKEIKFILKNYEILK